MGAIAWIVCIAAVGAGLAVPAAMGLAGSQFVSAPRLLIFGVVPLLAAMLSIVAIWMGRPARQLFAAYALAVGAALLAAEIFLAYEYVSNPPDAPVVASDASAPLPHLCPQSIDLSAPPIKIGDRPVVPLTGLANHPLAGRPGDPWRATDEHGFNNP